MLLRNELITLIKQQLLLFQPGDDYEELLLLSLIFLGEKTEKGVKIRALGAYHRARWMAKIIYCIKIYIFRNQFQLRAGELNSLRQFNVFIIRVYLKKWYTCQSSALAPLNDLQMLKQLIQYIFINSKIAEVTYEKNLFAIPIERS